MAETVRYYVLTPNGKVVLPGAASDQAAEALARAYSNQHLGGAAVRVKRRAERTFDVSGKPGGGQGNNPNG